MQVAWLEGWNKGERKTLGLRYGRRLVLGGRQMARSVVLR